MYIHMYIVLNILILPSTISMHMKCMYMDRLFEASVHVLSWMALKLFL